MFDFIGVLILIALIALFAYLTARAWRSKRSILKWGGGAIAGLVTLLLAAVLIAGLVGFYKINQKHDNPVADVQVTGTPAQNRHAA